MPRLAYSSYEISQTNFFNISMSFPKMAAETEIQKFANLFNSSNFSDTSAQLNGFSNSLIAWTLQFDSFNTFSIWPSQDIFKQELFATGMGNLSNNCITSVLGSVSVFIGAQYHSPNFFPFFFFERLLLVSFQTSFYGNFWFSR